VFVYSGRVISAPAIVTLQRSAAMLTRGQSMPVDRDVLIELCEELIEQRELLRRVGSDLRTIALRARQDG
jgi:hypothetical protein